MRIKKSAVPCLPAARVFAWRHQVFSDRPDYLQFARVSRRSVRHIALANAKNKWVASPDRGHMCDYCINQELPLTG